MSSGPTANPAKLQDCFALLRAKNHTAPMGTPVIQKPATWQRAKDSGTALYSWRRSIGLNRGTFARLANCSERTLATYEARAKLPATVRPQITEAIRLVQALLEMIPAEELPHWLQTPNRGFGGRKPWTLVQNGERDLIWAMIHQTRQGAFA
jgi:DNA-binding transcriptional regulator YiaG